jgi:hypothetical protein
MKISARSAIQQIWAEGQGKPIFPRNWQTNKTLTKEAENDELTQSLPQNYLDGRVFFAVSSYWFLEGIYSRYSDKQQHSQITQRDTWGKKITVYTYRV